MEKVKIITESGSLYNGITGTLDGTETSILGQKALYVNFDTPVFNNGVIIDRDALFECELERL